jgi:hypothetical protein
LPDRIASVRLGGSEGERTMSKLLDLLRAHLRMPAAQRPFFTPDLRLRPEERDAAVLAGKYPPDGADIESVSEYRLASLMQYPHY